CSPMTSLKTSIKTITYLSDIGCLEIQGASLATEEETPLLEAWKKYRVLLNRVDTSTAQDIEWPALP
uniref:tail fiber assembly protein n=1 Tax=Escherichia coli TaxID=562 RepID=UPI00201CC900